MRRVLLASVPRKSCVISSDLRGSRSFVSLIGKSTSQVSASLNLNQKRYGSSMNVILLENVANRGSRGEIVQVKRGYARNMLIPRKLAAYATPENKTKHEVIIEHRAKLIADGIIDATNVALSNASLIPQLANVAESQVIEFVRPIVTGSKGQLVGTVTVQDIQEYLKEGGYEMTSAANIMVPSVKNIGFYPIEIGDKKCILHVLQEIGAKSKEDKR